MSQGKRQPRKQVLPIISQLVSLLKQNTVKFAVCGSFRRNKDTIGDVDLVVLP